MDPLNEFDPLNAATGAEMVTSVKVLSQLCARRGLEIPPSRMADLITTARAKYNINQAYAGDGTVAARRPYQGFNDITYVDSMANSEYNALQMRVCELH